MHLLIERSQILTIQPDLLEWLRGPEGTRQAQEYTGSDATGNQLVLELVNELVALQLPPPYVQVETWKLVKHVTDREELQKYGIFQLEGGGHVHHFWFLWQQLTDASDSQVISIRVQEQ